jgi:hypothetical protein
MTLASEIYYTGIHPYTLQKIDCAKTKEEKNRQRLFFFWYLDEYRLEIKRILQKLKRNDLINKLFF